MAKRVIRLTPEEAKRRREQSYISATLSGMGRRQNNFLDTYGSDYLSQYRTQDELERYYADLAARAEDVRLLRYYTAAYGDEEGKKSLPDLDEDIRGYDRLLSGKQNAIDTFAMFNNAEEFNSVMQNLDYFNNYDIETNQEILDRMYKDREVYNAFSDAIGIMQPLTHPVYDENGNEIYFSDYFSDYDSTADISTLEGSKAALDSVRRDKEIRALEGELSAARLAQSNRLDLLDDFSEYSVETDGAVRSLKSEKFDKEMSNEERARYFYLFNTEGEEAANQYAKDLQDNLRQRRLQNMYEWSGHWYTAPLASIASVGTQIAGAIDNTINLVDYFASAGLSDLQTSNAVQYTKAFRGGVTDSIDSAVGKFLYNIFMSGVDTYVASKLPGNVGGVLLGASAAASKLDSELERGASENEAIASGIAAGVFEMIFESISIGKLKGIQQWMENADPKTLKDYVLKIASSMGVNASEEAATEIANIIWDTAVMQSDDFVLPDAVLQTAEAALSGAVMGAGFAGLGFARGSYLKNKSYIKKMAEIGSEIRNTADADRILAEYVENAKKSGGKAAKAAEGYEKIEPRLDVKEKKKNVAAGKLVTEAAKAKFMSESRKNATENLEETHKKAEASASNAKTAVDLADAGRKSRPKIVSIEGSELSDIKVEIDGEQKTAADITFEEETNYPLLYAYAPMLGSVNAANEFIQRYGGQKDIHRYFDDFLYYQLMGETAGAGKWESILKAKRPGVVLDVPDMYAAMQTGLEIRDTARKQKEEDAKKIAQEWKRLGGTEKSGKLDTTELRTYSMDEHQASVVEFARVLTEAFGFNITFYATKKGERNRGDGYFDAKTNTIHLDIEAGINEGSAYSAINSALLSTLSHEIVHSMAVNTPEQYGALRDFLVDWYAERGEDFEAKVLDLMDEQGLEREDAIEELIALTCEDLLYSSDALTEAMKEFYKKDEKAAKTFLDKLKEILDKILAFFNFAQKNRSAEASALEEGGKKVIMEAQKRFDAALIAIREANMANNAITEMAGLDTEAVTVSEDGTSLREEILDIVRKRGYQGDKARLRGINKYGIEVYETSEEIKKLSIKERQKVFIDIMEKEYRGRTAKFTRNGHTYYAFFYKVDVNKNVYGDKKSDKKGWKAKINVGADGDIFNLVENASYDQSKPESGKSNKSHSLVKFWDYYVKTVQIDNRVYDLIANIRKKETDYFVYSLQLIENKKIEASPSLGLQNSVLNRMLNASDNSISQKTDLSRENEKNIKNRLRKQTPEANEVLQAIFEEDPDLVGYADHKRELKKYKELMDSRESKLEKIADLDDQILALKSERRQSGKGTRMYELTKKRDLLEKDVNELQRRMFEMEAKELNKVIKRKTAFVAAKARKEANEKAREKRKERTENIAKRKYINRIQERAKDMMDLLEKNSQKEHIPDAIKEPIADFLDSLNFASKRSTEGGAKTKKEIRLDEKMERVKEALEGKEFHSELNLPPEFMEEFDALVKTVRDIATHSTDMGGFTLEAMTSEELKDLNRMLIILKKSVNQMNALIVNARFANAKAAADSSIVAFGEQSEKGGIHGKSNAASDFLNYDNITPVFFFERMGDAAYSMFESIVDGQNMMAKLADQLLKDSKKMFSEKEVQAWRKDIRHLTVQGKDVYISIPQIMYLYALQKREQSYSHIHGAGIVVEDQDKSLIDQIKEKKNGPMKNTARGFNITEDEVDSIVSLLNDRQKEVADALQKYMSTVGSEWGNYVSMRRFGIHSFTERNYVPIYTVKATDSEQETKKSTTRMDLYSLLNMSFTHSLKKDANNRAVIKDLFEVFSDHMVDMATYRSFALPLLDILKWRDYEYNVDTSSVELPGGKTEVALKDYMTDAYGEAAWNYLTNLLKDLNGAQQTGRGEGLARKMISNYKVAAVAANLRVALLQGTSYVRAANAMDVRDLSHVLSIFNPKETKRGYLLALEWCGLVKWKDLGYFQVDISDPLAKKITGENSARDTVVDWSMKLAEMGDQATIGNLWNALERETKRKRPDLAPGSKEFNEHVAKRLTEVILKTQVIDSVVTKSQVMRSKGGLVQVLSSFMSEPTLSYNNVVSNAQIAMDAKKRGDTHAQKKAIRGLCKSVSVFAIGAVMQALVGSISDALRDDDEEKDFGEKYLKNLVYNTLGELNPMGSIVFVKELEPILNNIINKVAGTEFPTYTSGRMDTAFVSSVITASNKIFKMFEKGMNSESFMQSTYALLKAVSQISGLPISNLIREVVSLWNSIVGLIDKDMVIELQ